MQKAQISKIENSVKSARLETILKVFDALGAKVNFNVELNPKNWFPDDHHSYMFSYLV